MNRLILAGVLLGVAFSGLGCSDSSEQDRVSLILDWFPNSNHAVFYLAQDSGYFGDVDLNVSITPPSDPTTIIATVGSGNADFGISYNVDVLQARSAGVEVVSVLALVQHPLVSIMSLPESGIESPEDLEGKRVGYPGIASQAGMLETMLASVGLRMDDLELSNVGFDLVTQLLSGNVDAILGAYFTHESIRIEQESGMFPNIIRVEEHGVPDYYELLLITNEETLNERPEVVERFVSAVRRGFEAATENRQGSITALLELTEPGVVDEELERRGVELLAPFWDDEGQKEFGEQLLSRWEIVHDWMVANGLIESNIDVSEAFTDRF